MLPLPQSGQASQAQTQKAPHSFRLWQMVVRVTQGEGEAEATSRAGAATKTKAHLTQLQGSPGSISSNLGVP